MPQTIFQPKSAWGSYQDEAIRPNVNRSFGDMLVAAATHPSMLLLHGTIYRAKFGCGEEQQKEA